MEIDATASAPAPEGARDLVKKVAKSLLDEGERSTTEVGSVKVPSPDGGETTAVVPRIRLKARGRSADLVIRHLPDEKTVRKVLEDGEAPQSEREDAELAMRQILATESLIAATLWHEVLAPETSVERLGKGLDE